MVARWKQFSQFVYRIDETPGAVSIDGGGFGSSNRLYEIRYPHPGTGLPSSADEHRIRYRYNKAGEQTAVIDQNGTTRLFARDSQGRLTDANGVVYNPVKLWTDNGFVNTVYVLSDAQMSVAGYVSASGRVRELRLYDSYGPIMDRWRRRESGDSREH